MTQARQKASAVRRRACSGVSVGGMYHGLLSLADALPVTLATEEEHHPEEDVYRRHEQNDERRAVESEAATTREVNEDQSVEQHARDYRPAKQLAECVAKMRSEWPCRSGERDKHDSRNYEEKKTPKPLKSAKALGEKPGLHIDQRVWAEAPKARKLSDRLGSIGAWILNLVIEFCGNVV